MIIRKNTQYVDLACRRFKEEKFGKSIFKNNKNGYREIVKSFAITQQGAEKNESVIADLKNHGKICLAALEYPREVEFINESPITTTGKVRRVELRQGLRS